MAGTKLIIFTWVAGVAAGCLSVQVAKTPASAVPQTMLADAGTLVETAPTGSAHKGPVTRAADGMFYVVARVNGAPVRFLIDTGASVVVLTDKDARRAGIAPQSSGYDGHMDTANGPSAAAWVTLGKIDVAGRSIRNVDAVIPKGELKVSLLGQNLLSRLDGFSVDQEHLTLR